MHLIFLFHLGVADQLQTNYASDLRNILKTVFEITANPHKPFDDHEMSFTHGAVAAIESSQDSNGQSTGTGEEGIQRDMTTEASGGGQEEFEPNQDKTLSPGVEPRSEDSKPESVLEPRVSPLNLVVENKHEAREQIAASNRHRVALPVALAVSEDLSDSEMISEEGKPPQATSEEGKPPQDGNQSAVEGALNANEPQVNVDEDGKLQQGILSHDGKLQQESLADERNLQQESLVDEEKLSQGSLSDARQLEQESLTDDVKLQQEQESLRDDGKLPQESLTDDGKLQLDRLSDAGRLQQESVEDDGTLQESLSDDLQSDAQQDHQLEEHHLETAAEAEPSPKSVGADDSSEQNKHDQQIPASSADYQQSSPVIENATLADDLLLQQVEGAVADDLLLQQNEDALADDLLLQQGEGAVADDLLLQQGEGAVADDLLLQESEGAVADDLLLQLDDGALADDLLLQQGDGAVILDEATAARIQEANDGVFHEIAADKQMAAAGTDEFLPSVRPKKKRHKSGDINRKAGEVEGELIVYPISKLEKRSHFPGIWSQLSPKM